MSWEWFVKAVMRNTFSILHFCDLSLLLCIWLTDHPTLDVQVSEDGSTCQAQQPLNYHWKNQNPLITFTFSSADLMQFEPCHWNFLTQNGNLQNRVYLSSVFKHQEVTDSCIRTLVSLRIRQVKLMLIITQTLNLLICLCFHNAVTDWRSQFYETRTWKIKN